ncbi:uncharacterized protein K02A2.6-like [Armigeres subalbatus]|uniref:uncharacterized protein K02A2.6-like n=1 Tax=Armigeres subalbatus TaxID=124917 RepID=UPI002ED59CC9
MATNSVPAHGEEIQQAILQMADLLQWLATPTPINQEKVLESLSTNMIEFVFDPDNGITFEKWFARYSDLFDNDARNLDDAAKVRLLLRKLDHASHSRYVNYILPRLPKDIQFIDTVSTLKKIFGTSTSVFNKRFQCLQLVKSEAEDIISYGGKVNRACEEFEFAKVSIDHFKCLVFVCGLKASRYADVRARLLSRMEGETANAPVTLQTLIDEFQRLVNLKADTTLIEKPSVSKHVVHSISEKKEHQSQRPSKAKGKQLPSTPCWQCGQVHYLRFVTTIINDVTTSLQLYSASDITIICEQTWHQLGNPQTTTPSINAVNASGEPLGLIGDFEFNVTLNGTTKRGKCFVSSSPSLNVFGIDWIDMFNLWALPFDSICNSISSTTKPAFDDEIQKLRSDHPNVFDDSLGHCTKTKRPVPFNTIPLVDTELNRLESMGIITPIDFSEWAAPIVAVRKPNGRVRICADYSTGLNNAIIDLSDAYLQVEVDDDSKKLLTINTHKGLFKFNRLAPGVKSAPGAFQRLTDSMIADIPGIRSFIDDAIVFGPTWEAHAESLNKLLTRLEHYLQAIDKIPAPTNVTELRSFLGAVNYYGRFVRNIHELRQPLDQLLKKDVKWQWNDRCQQSFKKFKAILQSELLLTHYDPTLPIIVAADASNTGIGAVILHKFADGKLKAVQHASRSLTPAEQGYGQPEKEALALVYAVTKFHKFLLGRHFTLQTDHKPLLAIFGSKKGIPLHTANRLQRWALIMLNYDFDIQHISSNDFGCADMLSRLIDRTARPEEEYVVAAINLEEDIVSIINDSLDKLPVTFTALQQATKKSTVLQLVAKFIEEGWPRDSKSITNPDLLPYYNRRDSLSIVNGCVMLHDRVVVPHQFQRKILRQFHQGHPGVVRMKAIARSFAYWPGIDIEIEEFVRNCSPCCIAGKAPVKTTLESWPAPSKPWSRIHIDYAGPVDGVYFLVVVDPFSKWPEVFATRTTTASTTTRLLYELFATFGIPETIVSDNGPQFAGLSSPIPVRDPVPAPESPVVPAASERDSGDSEYFSESDFEEEPILEPTVNNKPKRTVRLPARFEPYYLN